MESKGRGPSSSESKSSSSRGAKAEGKSSHDSDEEEAAVEREFKQLLTQSNEGTIAVAQDPRGKLIAEGFKINWMNMRDASTGTIMWESGEWGEKMWRTELKARIPADILLCRAVSREINFSSREQMSNFKLEQRIFYQGVCIEEWFFNFGFVIPGSTNSWQQIIEAAGEDQMMTAEQLSGEVTIETTFLDGKSFIAKCLVRLYYV